MPKPPAGHQPRYPNKCHDNREEVEPLHGSVLGLFAYGALQASEVAGKDVLEVGSLDVNGSVRPMVEIHRPRSYVGIDVEDGPGVDLVADAEELWRHYGPDSFDVVISTECLEHVENWRRVISSMATVLRPGGVLVITTRSEGFGYHHPPDRWRYTQASFAEIGQRLNLEVLALMDDPEYPGVFVKYRKPAGWQHPPDQLEGVAGVTAMADPLKLLMLPAGVDGTGYYRMWQPARQLVQRHLLQIPPPNPEGLWWPTDSHAASFDLIAAQRVSAPDTLDAWKRWKGGPKLVYETDDHLLAPDRSALPHLQDETVRETVIAALRLADLVTTSTEPLAAALREYTDAPVVAIEDHIHADLLAIERPRPERVTIGWAGGLNHAQDLEVVRRPVRSLLARHRDVDFHCMGWDFTPTLGRCRFTGWQPNVWDYYRSIDADIWLCPLVPTPFNRTRSHIKALEGMALGIPVIASDLEPYRELVIDGETGFVVRTQAQWVDRLELLIGDPELREAMGQAGRKRAHEWTIQDGWTQWADAYERTCR